MKHLAGALAERVTLTNPPAGEYKYWASCPDLTYALAQYMPGHADEITYGTLRKHVSREEMLKNPWGVDALWRISAPDNWAVRFFKSTLPSGTPTYYIVWSGYEIYFIPKKTNMKKEKALAERVTL